MPAERERGERDRQTDREVYREREREREGEEGVWGKKTGRIARLPSTSSQQTIMLTCSWLSNEKQVIEKASGNENNHITQ